MYGESRQKLNGNGPAAHFSEGWKNNIE